MLRKIFAIMVLLGLFQEIVAVEKREFNIMPSELVDSAKKNECDQIIDFYNVIEAYGPPFVYDFVVGKDLSRSYTLKSSAFWCRLIGYDDIYLLITNVSDELKDLHACSSIVTRKRKYIGGLYLKSGVWDLSGFKYVDTNIKGSGKYSGVAIVSSTEAYDDIFICDNKQRKWLIRTLD